MGKSYSYSKKDRERRKLQKRKWKEKVFEFLGGFCVNCRSKFGLEIDHIDPKNKTFNPNQKWTMAWEEMIKELEKCQLLCCICHLEKSIKEGSIKHYGEENGSYKHGNYKM